MPTPDLPLDPQEAVLAQLHRAESMLSKQMAQDYAAMLKTRLDIENRTLEQSQAPQDYRNERLNAVLSHFANWLRGQLDAIQQN